MPYNRKFCTNGPGTPSSTEPHIIWGGQKIIGYPTPKVMATYSSAKHQLLGAMKEDELIGLAIIEERKNSIILWHIAVKKFYQHQVVEKELIYNLSNRFTHLKL